MHLQFHNQLSKSVEKFTPIQEKVVTLYTCGPTVYSAPHIGNWASFVHWDTLVRLLTAEGYAVNRVMNITDVGHLVSDADDGEDKLEKGARREGKTAWEVAAYYSEDFLEGMKKLNFIMPTHIPKATEYIPQMVSLVGELKQKGFTYQISDGIYFDTAKFPTYGDFAGLNVEALKAGARVEFNPEKRNASDFALWKFTVNGEKRDMEWPTPSELTDDGVERPGFPGWHIECSAMAMELLGTTIDIHTGGIDHIPVHHTNEIAQSESASGVQFANYWMHNNHLKSNGTKISKSLGNGYTLQELAEKGFDPLDLRMFVLQTHYRSEGNFTFENLEAAKNRRQNWRNTAALRHQIHSGVEYINNEETVSVYPASGKILEVISDDLNVPEAFAVVDEAFSDVQSASLRAIDRRSLIDLLETIDALLGLELVASTPDISEDDKRLIIERRHARDAKDFTRSDEIRDALLEKGIALRDTSNGTIWEYA